MNHGDLADVLKAFEDVMVGAPIPGSDPLDSDHVTIGYVSPDEVKQKPRVMIWWNNDKYSFVDGDLEHTAVIYVGVQVNHDSSNESIDREVLLHATRVYLACVDAVEDAVSHMAESGLRDAGILSITQNEGGGDTDGWALPGPVLAGTPYDVTYRRKAPASRYE